jgi:hypothetical protein
LGKVKFVFNSHIILPHTTRPPIKSIWSRTRAFLAMVAYATTKGELAIMVLETTKTGLSKNRRRVNREKPITWKQNPRLHRLLHESLGGSWGGTFYDGIYSHDARLLNALTVVFLSCLSQKQLLSLCWHGKDFCRCGEIHRAIGGGFNNQVPCGLLQ